MSEARVILRNTTVHGLARAVELGTAAVVALMVSRWLQASGLGVYATAMAYYGLLAIAAELGASNLLVREIARDRSRTSELVVHIALLNAAAAAVLLAGALLVIPFLGYEAETRTAVLLALVALLPGTLRAIQEAVFVAYQRVEFITYTTIGAAILNLPITFVLLRAGHGVLALLGAFVAIQFLIAVGYQVLMRLYVVRLEWVFDRASLRRLLGECRTFAASSIVAGLFARPEVIILSALGGSAQVGYYSAAAKLVDLWQIIPQVYMTNIFPALSRAFHRGEARAARIQATSIKYLLAIGLPIAAGIAATADTIVVTLYGPGFEPSVPLVQLLALNVPLFCINSVLWRVLSARSQQGTVLRIQCITAATRLMTGYGLIAVFGALGAALATPANLLAHNLLLARAVRRSGAGAEVARLGWRFAVAAAGMGAIAWVLHQLLAPWVVVPVAALVYGLLVFAVRAVSLEDLVLLRRMLPLHTPG